MDIISGIAAFFTSLPKLIELVQSFIVWINHVSGNDPQGYAKALAEALNKLNAAQSQEERQDAAKALADVIQGLS